MRIISFFALLLCCTFSIQAGTVSTRYLECSALLYGINSTSSSVLTTHTRLRTIVEKFEPFQTSQPLAAIVTKALETPDDPEVVQWASDATPKGPFISDIVEWVKLTVVQKGQQQFVLSPTVQEFNYYTSPFVAARKLNIPFPSFFDENMTTYVVAGLSEKLQQHDLNAIKEMALENFADPGPQRTPTYSLLAKFYVNQTEDVEFLKTVWAEFPFERTTILWMCAFAKQQSPLVRLGRELAEEAYTTYTAEPNNTFALPVISTAAIFLQFHLQDPLVNQLACRIIRKPMAFQSEKVALIYGLVMSKEDFPWESDALKNVQQECELTSAALATPTQ